ncbi:hypothetical protein [Rhizorhabdus sp. FW153]|uniref:hypothetical protein n=1 Tax=Rhizorhabdus sp. FW153 TaxID=3400216 RepID=UPI003CE78F26
MSDNIQSFDSRLDDRGISTSPMLALGLAIAASVILSAFLSDLPSLLFITVDFLFCMVLFLTLTGKWKSIILLHPFLILFFSFFYSQSFLDQGDGPAYEQVISQFFDTKTLTINYDSWILRGDLLGIFKTAGFGVIPTYLIPDQISEKPEPIFYYLWQSAFHAILLSVAACLAKTWNSISNENLDIIILYSLLGPSFFELGVAPTRHYVTFFSILLFYICFMAITKSISLSKICTMAIAIVLIIISKSVLMAPVIIFIVIFFAIRRSEGKVSTSLIGLSSALVGAITLGPFLLLKLRDYGEGVAMAGTGSMGYLVAVPIIGQILKLLFALLSPFPWYKADYFVDFIYGGNWPLFLMHIGSSLIGLHLFLSIALKWTEIYGSPDIEMRNTVIFGLIMSASIFGGATGFHSYILIYFPYLMLISKSGKYQVSPFIAVLVAAALNILMAITGFGATGAEGP